MDTGTTVVLELGEHLYVERWQGRLHLKDRRGSAYCEHSWIAEALCAESVKDIRAWAIKKLEARKAKADELIGRAVAEADKQRATFSYYSNLLMEIK